MSLEHDEALAIFESSLAGFLNKTAPPERIAQWNTNKQVDRDAWLAAGEFGMLGCWYPKNTAA